MIGGSCSAGDQREHLPPGSEILFREPTLWDRYSWQMLLIAAVILIQAGFIGGLLHERHRRQLAEIESRQRLTELAHANRYSAVGELTTSIAHELNQPLGSILTNAETAELMLKATSPDINEIRQILADIRRDDQRASEVIRRLRSVLKKRPFEIKDTELNDTVREAIGLVTALADGRRITLAYAPAAAELHVKGDPVQLQQVVLNLIINALDAVSDADMKKREVSVSTGRAGATPRSGSPTRVRALRSATSRTSSIHSSRPSLRAWVWGLQSSRPSSRPITAP